MILDPSEQSNQAFDFETENQYLKLTITALRDKIETLQIKQDEKIQKTKSASADEISQLQNTVNSLRDKLEKIQIREQEKIQKAVARANDENKQLKNIINMLREKLEVQDGDENQTKKK